MAPSGTAGGSIEELSTVTELKEWLLGRVGDDNDIVIDDLQEDYAEQFEIEDEKKGIRVGQTYFLAKTLEKCILGKQRVE